MIRIFIRGSNDQLLGPFNVVEVRQGLARGVYQQNQPAFLEGSNHWTPLGDLLVTTKKSPVDRDSALSLTAPTVARFSPSGSTTIKGFYRSPQDSCYASFIRRLGAWVIDFIIISLFSVIVIEVLYFMPNPGIDSEQVSSVGEVVSILLVACYFGMLESSIWQGTIGKIVFRVKVTDEKGNRIGPIHALVRFGIKVLSSLLCGVGYLMMLSHERKQTLHDIIARTLVLSK